MLSILILLLLMAAGPPAWLLMGETVLNAVFRLLGGAREEQPETCEFLLAYLLYGLLLYLCLVLALASLGAPLKVAALLAFTPALWKPERIRGIVRPLRIAPTINLALWLTVVLALGASILAVTKGIQTPWRNNYGDGAWHIGMISSFVFGDNFPPQNHIFPPERLSYPFFINLWSAALWVFHPTLAGLEWTFLYQWTFLWMAVYFALDGNRFRVLPWAVLFGGGAFIVLFRELNVGPAAPLATFGPYAHDLIDHGYPWVPFLDSIWLVQRPTIFGAALVLASVQLGHRVYYREDSEANLRDKRAFAAGALLGLSPLVHTHFVLAASAYLTLLLTAGMFRGDDRAAAGRSLEWFLVALAPAALFGPWILGKSGIVQIAGAWMQADVYKTAGLGAAVLGGLRLWRDNGLPWLFLTIFGVMVGGRYAAGLVLLVLFLAGNFTQVAAWSWDEMKIFIALYLISISLWQTMNTRRGRIVHWWLLVLIVPGVTEVAIVVKHYQRFTIYSAPEVAQANGVRGATKRESIIAAAPDHNSPITLTGRKMFYGYEGTLNSHGVKYEGRQAIEQDLERLKSCKSAREPVCPDYLYWTARERAYWKRPAPGDGVEPTSLDNLYKLP